MKARSSIRIPEKNHSRKTIYIDESGTSNIYSNDSRYFVLTGIIGSNRIFSNLLSYYILLKKKYLGFSGKLHSADLFQSYAEPQRGKKDTFCR